MKHKITGKLALAFLSAFLIFAVTALPAQEKTKPSTGSHAGAHTGRSSAAPLKLVGAIALPGNPLRFDISWVDQVRGRYYLGEAGNAAVDVIDAENDLYIGRIAGFHGLGTPEDCGPIEGMGPSGVLVTPDNHLWADDAHGTVKVFDLNGAKPPFTDAMPVATISTGAQCRADEIGYDPQDHVIMVGNPAEHPPYASVISSEPPYEVLAKIPFPDARGFEQPMWDPALKGGRMLATVPGMNGAGEVVVFNLKDPKMPVIEATYQSPGCSSGLVLGPAQHMLVGCGGGRPVVIMNPLTGKVIATAEGSHGADEVWYNPGDNYFYAPAAFGGNPLLSVIDATTGKLIDNLPAGPGSHSVAAYRGNNHVFVPIAIPTAAAPTDACNVLFGLAPKQGCIAVYAHAK